MNLKESQTISVHLHQMKIASDVYVNFFSVRFFCVVQYFLGLFFEIASLRFFD